MPHLLTVLILTSILVLSGSIVEFASAQNSLLPPPLKQFKTGISTNDVKCNQGFILIIKSSDGSPACVTSSTGQKLQERGWGVVFIQTNPVGQPTIPIPPVKQNETSMPPMQSVANTSRSTNASNAFGFSLFSNILQNTTGNVFFSPYSISNAFSMVFEGASTNTKDEIQSVFHIDKNDTSRRESVKVIDSELNNPNKNYTLSVANALWIQNKFPVLTDYSDILQKYYAANATKLDFENNPEGSRQTINTWVENKTSQKIKDLFPPGSINDMMRVVLTNAIYFKGNWSSQFNPAKTMDDDFHITPQQAIKVPMMTTESNFRYFSDKEIQALEMPYQGGNLSMIVLLPKENNLKSLTDSISVEKIHDWESKLTPEQVTVYMPKFTLNTKYILNDNLASMGMPTAFLADKADFSGITGKKDLFISIVVHQAFVQVDEKGTEAAAATGIGISATSIQLPINVFRADHPFVFLIYDNQTGLILFMGQLVDPSAK